MCMDKINDFGGNICLFFADEKIYEVVKKSAVL